MARVVTNTRGHVSNVVILDTFRESKSSTAISLEDFIIADARHEWVSRERVRGTILLHYANCVLICDITGDCLAIHRTITAPVFLWEMTPELEQA